MAKVKDVCSRCGNDHHVMVNHFDETVCINCASNSLHFSAPDPSALNVYILEQYKDHLIVEYFKGASIWYEAGMINKKGEVSYTQEYFHTIDLVKKYIDDLVEASKTKEFESNMSCRECSSELTITDAINKKKIFTSWLFIQRCNNCKDHSLILYRILN